MRVIIAWYSVCLMAILPCVAVAGVEAQCRLVRSWTIGEVVADFPVGFCLLSAGERQYVAYYDAQRRMTVASRAIASDEWRYQVLPSEVAWDSHNYVTMAVDADGHLHVSGNMHAVPLVYFRTRVAGDIASLEAVDMVGTLEQRVTYPKFLKGGDGRLIFTYRHGGSGNGIQIYNQYDPSTLRWSRFLDRPLLDGKGETNAYASTPSLGPDGRYHMAWVWRDTPDCATNHHLSYARSSDLKRWESAGGKQVDLPITLDQKNLWVDPVPSGGGIINGGFRLRFDARQRPMIAYHKSDAAGNMQLYITRFEDGEWRRRQVSTWEKPVLFSGNGSMGFIGIGIRDFDRVAEGVLRLSYRHRDYGVGEFQLDEITLEPLAEKVAVRPGLPKSLERRQGGVAAMQIMRARDEGVAADSGRRYLLQWEAMPPNRDQAQERVGPSTLMLHELRVVD